MFKKAASISGTKNWKALSGEVISNRVLIIKNIDIYFSKAYFTGPFLINSSFVRVDNCHKNFVLNNLQPHILPNIKFLYLNSAPTEDILKMWDLSTNPGFLGVVDPTYSHIFQKYKKDNLYSKWICIKYE